MGSKLINHTLDKITSGITQQYEEGAFESQVRDMVNCIPSLSRGILRRNPIEASTPMYTDNTGSTIYTPPLDSYVYMYDRGTDTELYIVIIDRYNLRVYNLTDNVLKPRYVLLTAGTYLAIAPNKSPIDSYDMVTIGDHTFIVNKTKIPSMAPDTGTPAEKENWDNKAFYWIKKTTGVVVEQKQTTTGTDPSNTTSGSRLEGYEYILNSVKVKGEKATAPFTAVDRLSASEIAAEFAKKLLPPYLSDGAFVIHGATTYWDWEDSFGNEASLGVWKDVDSASKLPSRLPNQYDGFITRVSGGSSAKDDDYFLKYDKSVESWVETRNPYSTYKYDSTTMPHVLYRLADGSFVFDDYKVVSDDGLSLLGTAWEERKVGDEVTNENPSFIGKEIKRVFFHKNRLGFLTNSNIILSGTGAYGNFFSQTVQDILDDDPIDLAVATTNVTVLRDVANTSGTLLLFADDAQFELLAQGGGVLTPNTADIRAVSRYNFNPAVPVRAIGNRVYFTSTSGGYNQLFSYKVSDQGAQITEATPLTMHIPSYLPDSLFKLEGHSVLGYTFMIDSSDRKSIYVLNNTSIGAEDVQNAFSRWEFAYNIVSIGIINNDLVLIFDTGDVGLILLEIPGDIDNVVYQDMFSTPKNYNSYIKLLQFFWRDRNGKGTSRGRLQLRTLKYTITPESKYMTTLLNTNLLAVKTPNAFGPTWTDTEVWNDTLTWLDIDPVYTRVYKNDSKVTVMSDSRYLDVTIGENPDEPTKGFELATINAEMLFHQRSSRT